jgi:excisionase family DNA binding protein
MTRLCPVHELRRVPHRGISSRSFARGMLEALLMQTQTIKLLASRQEAAEALGVSVRTIDALAKRGDLRAIRIRARKLFPWTEIQRIAGSIESTVQQAASG